MDNGIKEKVIIQGMFKDMLKYSPSKIFGILGNTITIPIYTNLLSQGQYGLYTIATATLSFLCILFSDWVGLSGLRFFAKFKIENKISNYLSTLVILLAFNVLLAFVFGYIFRANFYDFFKIPHKMFFAILILVIPVAIRALLSQILRAQIKPLAFTISTIVNQILTILIAVFIIKYFHMGAFAILISMGISISLIDLLLIFQSGIYKHFKFEKIPLSNLKSIFHYGLPISLTSLSLWLMTQGNKFMLQYLDGSEKVGLVGVAYNLTFSILMTLFAVITIAAFPRIINLYEEKIDVRPIISKLTYYFILAALPVIVIVSLYSQDVVLMMANKNFEEAHILVPYLAFSAFFLSLSEYTTFQYYLSKKTYINTAIRVISGLFGLVLSYFLIKKWGLFGVGVATLITNVFYFILSITIVLPDLEWKVPYKKIFLILLAFIPSIFVYLKLLSHIAVPAAAEMSILAFSYYVIYFLLNKLPLFNGD